jgi:hypothetical protein
MSRTIFWISLIFCPVIVGSMSIIISKTSSQEEAQTFFLLAIQYGALVYIPFVCVLRMCYLKFTLKEMLTTIVPIYGAKLRHRVYYDK